MKILIHGIGGRMGGLTARVAGDVRGILPVVGVDAGWHGGMFRAGDVMIPVVRSLSQVGGGIGGVVDFSRPDATEELLAFCVREGSPLVIGTTGQGEAELDLIRRASARIPIVLCANFSPGMACLLSLARQAAGAFPAADTEILEIHRRGKADAPSGSALVLARQIADARQDASPPDPAAPVKTLAKAEAVRPGARGCLCSGIPVHALRLTGAVPEHRVIFADDGECLTLTHTVSDPAVFCRGALRTLLSLEGRAPGMYGDGCP